MKKEVCLQELCKRYSLNFEGQDVKIDGLGFVDRSTNCKSIIAYITSDKYTEEVAENAAISCLILPSGLREEYSKENTGRQLSFIISSTPEVAFYQLHEAICRDGFLYDKYDFKSKIGDNCQIADTATIEDGVIIGNNVTIGHHSVVRSGSIIEDSVIIGCNSTIGSEGFQIIIDSENRPVHITHVGRCHLCRNVYVGDNTCVCNSLFDSETYIGEGAKIDNLVHIGHNCYIGSNAVITAQVILCGSSYIEDGAWIAPNTAVLNRVVIGANSKIGLGSVVTRNVDRNAVVYGVPAKSNRKSGGQSLR